MASLPTDIINKIKEYIPRYNQCISISGMLMKALVNFYNAYCCSYYEPFPSYALTKHGFKIYLLKYRCLNYYELQQRYGLFPDW